MISDTSKNMEKVGLSSPWVLFYRQVEALFKEDPAVTVTFDDENYNLELHVEGATKAEAIEALLPSEKTFGNITVHVTVIPANIAKMDKASIIERAFEGNPALSAIIERELFAQPVSFITFKKAVVQYFSDNLGDLHGVTSTLYQDLAKEVFGDANGVFYCTDVTEGEADPEEVLDNIWPA